MVSLERSAQESSSPGLLPLSPISFLERAGDVFRDKPAVITESDAKETYSEFRREARHVAQQLRRRGISGGDRVALLARNGPDALRMHFAVPGAAAVLVAMNVRLSPDEYAFILNDSRAKILLVESALAGRILPITDQIECPIVELPDADTREQSGQIGQRYDEWLGDRHTAPPKLELPDSELAPISINYTSGTTGRPKGAVYTHRGAYLNALGIALELRFTPQSAYLWTLPMFHCNGWCCTWAVTALGATHVTLADFRPAAALRLIDRHQVTHLCGAPVVLNELATGGGESQRPFEHDVHIATGGAPPAPTTIAAMRQLGINVVHLYGLTESYGPSLICEVQPQWENFDSQALAKVLSRQGVRTVNVEAVRVVDSDFSDVAADGETLGEIAIRSNTVVSHYHGDPATSAEAFRDDWLMTGDLAVVHPDGYVEVRDRRKDIIISGGENVSSIEVENALASHPAVSEAAVVAAPHPRWGEVPVAFVDLRPSRQVDEATLIQHVRDRLAHFKAPKAIIFGELAKTSTGKIQKYQLRDRANRLELE